jgi:hypothetical protein
MTAVNGKGHLCRSAFLPDPRDPGQRPCHHRPYAQNSLIWIPRVVIVIGYRLRTERRLRVRVSWRLSRCPVSLKMRHGQRHYLRCLKYVRQLARSVVSPIMRQVREPLALSYQVSGADASFR